MVVHEAESSPQVYARIGGVLYLIIIVAGLFGEAFVRNNLIVSGDVTATAENIRSSELLWRVGIAGNIFHLACAVALALFFYVLLGRSAEISLCWRHSSIWYRSLSKPAASCTSLQRCFHSGRPTA